MKKVAELGFEVTSDDDDEITDDDLHDFIDKSKEHTDSNKAGLEIDDIVDGAKEMARKKRN